MSIESNIKKLAEQAQSAYKNKQYSKAAELYHVLEHEYKRTDDHVLSAEMANNRSVSLLQAGEPSLALEAVKSTEKIFLENKDPIKAAMALGNQAAALEEMKRLEEALSLYTRSSEMLSESGDQEMRSIVQKRIAALQVRTGKKLEATASMYAALENQEKLNPKEKTLKTLLEKMFGLMGLKSKK